LILFNAPTESPKQVIATAKWCFREVACPMGSAPSQARRCTGAGTWAGGWTPGDHETMFKEGNIEIFGQLLQEVLEKEVLNE
jgi:hypothetical protein